MRPSRRVSLLIVAASWIAIPLASQASEPDLTTWIDGPSQVNLGTEATFVVSYANLGPGDAYNGFVNVALTAGFPVRIDELTEEQFQALAASAAGTDSHGNSPQLFFDYDRCEGLYFQLQGPTPPHPVIGLEAGGSGSFSFNLPTPLDEAVVGKLIVHRADQRNAEFLPALTRHQMTSTHSSGRYASGANCSSFPFRDCEHLDNCFGPRLWMIRPFTAGLTVVDDGGVTGDPSKGCGPFQGFDRGRVAVVRSGTCSPFTKARNAQLAGASAVIVVNDGGCVTPGEVSPDCVVPMDGGPLAGTIDIPVVMLSFRDGEDLIAAVLAGEPVTVTMGGMTHGPLQLTSFVFSSNAAEIDPDPQNNGHTKRINIGTFADSFETGSCSRWSCSHP